MLVCGASTSSAIWQLIITILFVFYKYIWNTAFITVFKRLFTWFWLGEGVKKLRDCGKVAVTEFAMFISLYCLITGHAHSAMEWTNQRPALNINMYLMNSYCILYLTQYMCFCKYDWSLIGSLRCRMGGVAYYLVIQYKLIFIGSMWRHSVLSPPFCVRVTAATCQSMFTAGTTSRKINETLPEGSQGYDMQQQFRKTQN